MSVALTSSSKTISSTIPTGSGPTKWWARTRWASLIGIAALVAAGACEGEQRAHDASAPPSLRTAEISVRFDVNPLKTPVMSVLAFQAAVSGVAQRDVLGIVDPLAAAAPERDCELRDLDLSANALVARGGSIELQELGGIGIALGDSTLPASSAIVRPFPRLFPDVATVVGGIVAEAGPLQLAALPERVGLLTAASELPLEELAVPAAPRIATVNGSPLAAGAKLDARDGLTFTVASGGGAGGTIVELRPFGATVAIACAVPETGAAESTLVVPRALIGRLAGSAVGPSGGAGSNSNMAIPASLDVLSRARVRVAPLATSSRLSIEVRASTAVEIRP